MKATFPVDDKKEYTFVVDWAWYGAEKYYLNGELIKKQWSISLGGKRQFSVGGHQIELVFSVKTLEPLCKINRDGKLFIDELFPELKAKILAKKKKGFSWNIFLKSAVIWFFVALLATFLFDYIKSK